jgi:hypothetical protein
MICNFTLRSTVTGVSYWEKLIYRASPTLMNAKGVDRSALSVVQSAFLVRIVMGLMQTLYRTGYDSRVIAINGGKQADFPNTAA